MTDFVGNRGRGLVAPIFLAAIIVVGCQSQVPTPSATSAPVQQATAAPPTASVAAQPTTPAKAPAPTSAPTAAPTAVPSVLKIGISVPLSGQGAKVGQSAEYFQRMSMDDVNAKGGVKVGGKTYLLEGVTADDKGSSDGGREAANRLVLSEKVRFVIGASTSPVAGAQPITEPAKVLLFASAASDKSLGSSFPLTFQVGTSHQNARSAALYEWLAKDFPKAKRVVQIMPDNVTGRTIGAVGEVNAKAVGMEVVGREFFPDDIKDFNPIVTRVMRQNPDAIETQAGIKGPQFLALMKALADQGFRGPSIGTSVDTAALKEAAGWMKSTFTSAMLADYKSPVVVGLERDILQRFVAKHGEAALEPYSDVFYNAAFVLSQVILKVGTVDDTEKLATALRDGEWDTLWSDKWGKSRFVGKKTFGAPVVLEQPIYLSQANEGKVSTFTAIKPAWD